MSEYNMVPCYCCGGPADTSLTESYICSVCMEEVEDKAARIIWNQWKAQHKNNAECLVKNLLEEMRQAHDSEAYELN